MGSKSGGFMARNFGLVFGGIWLVVGLPFLLIGLAQWYSQTRFSEDAVQVRGTVIAKEISRASRNRSTEYEVAYRFTGPDGELIQGQQEVSSDLWDSLTERGPVEIEYLPGDPHTHRVAGETDWVFILVFSILGGMFTGAGGVIFGISLKNRLARSRLLDHGQPATATVTKVQESNMSVNGRRQWRIIYRYLDMYGVQHEGKSGYLPPDEAHRWEPGDQGRIYHDPQAPEKSAWVGRPES